MGTEKKTYKLINDLTELGSIDNNSKELLFETDHFNVRTFEISENEQSRGIEIEIGNEFSLKFDSPILFNTISSFKHYYNSIGQNANIIISGPWVNVKYDGFLNFIMARQALKEVKSIHAYELGINAKALRKLFSPMTDNLPVKIYGNRDQAYANLIEEANNLAS